MNNEDKIRKALSSEPVPDTISPENIKKMLDEKAPAKKRKNIKTTAVKFTAAAAACAVICGVGAYAYGGQNKNSYKENISVSDETKPKKSTNVEKPTSPSIGGETDSVSSVNFAEDYSDIYRIVTNRRFKNTVDAIAGEFGGTKSADYEDDIFYEETAEADGAFNDVGTNDSKRSADSAEHSETYNQEEGVLEADIVKTDGEFIYYLYNDYVDASGEVPKLNIAHAENGGISETETIYITPPVETDSLEYSAYVQDMYLYNNMLVVIGNYNDYSDDLKNYTSSEDDVFKDVLWSDNSYTFVNIYTMGINPELTDSYCQEGYYSDVRITPEGYMYLITEYSSADFGTVLEQSELKDYIPAYRTENQTDFVPADCIILPEDEDDIYRNLDYTVIGGLDLNVSENISQVDVKAVSGFTGNIYCSGNNLYMAQGLDNTEITRYELSQGNINPVASGTVEGYVNDQFSMSEYNGYFRIATTHQSWTEYVDEDVASVSLDGTNNFVFVLDMDLNIVGFINDFGVDESIKSVNFSGDIAYVVTYEQTDPLFAIDLSKPEQPVILDDLHMLGYSSYMQLWSEGMLFGFGADADEDGIEIGYKLSMFDNSDPENLSVIDSYSINKEEDSWLYSEAMWDRKALFIAPEKNLIGFPITSSYYNGQGKYSSVSSYIFLSFEDGKFVYQGEFIGGENKGEFNLNRAVYIGNTVYALSPEQIIYAPVSDLGNISKVNF